MNLKDNFAVFPSKRLILSGSSTPGSWTRILSRPCDCIKGSFVPLSSILLLTISRAFFKVDAYKDLRPFSEKSKINLSSIFEISKLT